MKLRDLLDVTFIIPFGCDSPERTENLRATLKYLCDNFATNILVIEDIGSTPSDFRVHPKSIVQHYKMQFRADGVFHRTRIINEGIKMSGTPYICIYDTDVIFDRTAPDLAAQWLRDGYAMVFCYDGVMVDINRELYLKNGTIKEHHSYAVDSVGGAVFLNKDAYKQSGYENENLISHAPEDAERFSRMTKLGYHYGRIRGKCYHLPHPRGKNSSPTHEFVAQNMAEYEKIKNMSRKELEEYILTWGWNK